MDEAEQEVPLIASGSEGGNSLRHRKQQHQAKPRQGGNDLVRALTKLDVYPKTVEDFTERTSVGGAVSIVTVLLMLALFVYELSFYLSDDTVDKLSVDLSGNEKLRINLNITFHSIPCADVGIDVMDMAGDQQIAVNSHMTKTELDAQGKVLTVEYSKETERERRLAFEKRPPVQPCGPCFVPTPPPLPHNEEEGVSEGKGEQAEGQGGEDKDKDKDKGCCESCEEVRQAFKRAGLNMDDAEDTPPCEHERAQLLRLANLRGGCELAGFVEVNKVGGNFHFAPGVSFQHKSGHHVHNFQPSQAARFNVSHTINLLSFGEYQVPGRSNPLDGEKRISAEGPGVFQYFIKIVPTAFQDKDGTLLHTHQFAVTEHAKRSGRDTSFILPGVFFVYDFHPIMVTIVPEDPPFLQFVTKLCAIVGGVFTVSGLVDALIHNFFNPARTRRLV